MVSTSLKELGGNTRKTIDNLDKPWSRWGWPSSRTRPSTGPSSRWDQPDHMVRADEGKSPRPHQLQAMAAVKRASKPRPRQAHQRTARRGTYTSLLQIMRADPEDAAVLFLVPSISTLSRRSASRQDTSSSARSRCARTLKVGKSTTG